MALTATIFRVELSIADIERAVYHDEALRLAQHPSEERERLVARLLAYALCWEPGLAFARDLADADEPALWRHDDTGQLATWIEVGAPTGKRMHRVAKQARQLVVVTYRGQDDGLDALRREIAGQRIHRAEETIVLAFAAAMVAELAAALERSSRWNVIVHGESVQVVLDDALVDGGVRRLRLADLSS